MMSTLFLFSRACIYIDGSSSACCSRHAQLVANETQLLDCALVDSSERGAHTSRDCNKQESEWHRGEGPIQTLRHTCRFFDYHLLLDVDHFFVFGSCVCCLLCCLKCELPHFYAAFRVDTELLEL